MDRRTALALALALLIFGIFTAMQAKYAPKPVRRPAVAGAPAAPVPGAPDSGATAAAPGSGAGSLAPAATPAAPAVAAVRESTSVIETPLYRATFSNRGARMLAFELKRFALAHGPGNLGDHPERRPKRGGDVPEADRVRFAGGPTFGIDLGSGGGLRPLDGAAYAVAESLDAAGAVRALTYTLRDSSGALVRQTWRVRPDSYLLDLEVETAALPQAWRLTDYSLSVRSWPLVTEANLANDLRGLRAVSLVGKDLHRDGGGGLVGKAPKVHEGVAHFAGVQTHYFMGIVAAAGADGRSAVASATQRTLTPEQLQLLPKGTKDVEPVAQGTLVMPLPPSGAGVRRFVAYFGPSDYDALAKQGGPLELQRAVDMGWNWILPFSRLLLWLLKAIDAIVHNFGITILLLATIVRLALHPLNMSSMKSMRAMQRLQPEIERIRKKYEKDAQGMNTAMMALYKENGVNPAGGCLPMLLQMPLFFALYSVILNAVDLRQAPFVGWIHDLSAPDQLFAVAGFPVRLLPVLMAATGFLSQRFTPTDPRQAPTMYMMNIVMLGIFYPMPSGLVLYWTVMNLLTALQQWLAMRGDSGAVVVPAEEPTGKKRGR